MAINRAALKAAIQSAPYAGNNAPAILALLNSADPAETATFDVDSIDAQDAQAAVIAGEFIALTDAAQRAWGIIVGLGTIPIRLPAIRAQILAIWGAGTTTRSNLADLQTRKANRCEVAPIGAEGDRVTKAILQEAMML